MRVGALYAILRLETGAFNGALTASEGRFGKFLGVLKAGGLIAAQALAVVAGFSLKTAMDFEQHMSQSLAIMGEVSDGMRDKMEAAARAVAKTSTFSANEAADAYYFLASAGYDAEQSIAALPTVTQFAQAGVLDLEKATSLLMDAQTTMGLRTADVTQNMANMARVSDVLTHAGVQSNATLEEMATALLNKAGPALRVVGKDIEEGAAVLMVMANAGVKGQVAGTQLGIILRELQTKAIGNKDAFAKAGVAVFDASGEMRNMGDIVGDLEKSLAGLSDEQKKQALLDLGFTDRSVGVIQSLLGTSDAIKDYETQLRNAGGATEEVATKQLDTFQAQMTLAWHKIQDLAISIGQKLLPGARDMVEGIGNWIDKNHELIETIAVGIFDAIGKIAGAIGSLVSGGIKAIGDAIGWITNESNGLIFAIRGVLTDTEIFEDEAGPIWNAVGEAVQLAVHVIRDAFATFTDEVLPVLIDSFTMIMDEVVPLLGDAFTWIAEEVIPMLAGAFDTFTSDVLPFFIEVIRVIVEDIVPRLVDVFNTMMSTILPALGVAFDFISTEVLPRIGAVFNWLREDVIPPLMSIFEFVVSWFISNWPTISSIVGQVFGAVAEAFKIVANVIGFVVPIIWGIVQPIAAVLFPIVGAAASALLSALDIAFRAIGGVFDVFGDVANGIFTAITTVWEGLAGFFGGILDEVSGTFKSGLNVIIDVINGFIGFLNNIHIDIPRINIPGTDLGVGGGSIDPFNIGTIPHLAKGTRFFSGGLALVGETGPELAYLPHGSQVFPSATTAGMLGGGEITVRVKDDDGAIRAGRYDQGQIERVLSEALREMVGGAQHRALRVGM